MKELLKKLTGCLRKSSLGMRLAVIVAMGFIACSAEAQPATHTLHGNIPSVVQKLKPIGDLEPTVSMRLAIGLPLHNREALTNLLEQMYDPASPNYQQYLTPEQFTQMFGPTEQEYKSVQDFAKANGLAVSQTHPNRMVLDVTAKAADIQKALHIKFKKFQHPNENRTFFAPDADPSVPVGLPIQDIAGLSDYRRPHPNYHINHITNAVPNSGTGPFGLFIGNDFRNAYAPDIASQGNGQVVALLQFDGYFANDIAQYQTIAGLPAVTLTNVLLDGFDGFPTFNGGEVEVSLDIEMVMSMAQGLSKIIVYEAGPFGSPVDIFNRMVTDNQARQISSSWGWIQALGARATTDQIFQEMALQGQTYFNASGDSDAFLSGEVDDPNNTTSPSSSPFITQVGGTTLTTGSSGAWASETVWNSGLGIGSSGGISSFYDIPSYQQGISMTANKGSTTKRNIPDVALTGDNVFVVADGGFEFSVTGTSCAAPLWAGFMSLINQQAANLGRPSLGFINPLIYAIGKGSSYNSSFHDIKTGDNTSPFSPLLFPAVAGYDLCTGWGTPRGQALINAMLALTPSGLLQATVNPPPGSALIKSLTQPVFVTVNDVLPVTNATVTASISGQSDLVFHNDGVNPDVTANDNTSSVNFQAPANTGPITLSVHATAPGEVGVTNTVPYTIIATPGNDDFASAQKVPAAGAVYLSNNKFATMQRSLGEPNHDNVTNVDGSLWWDWTPASNTNVFVDTTGSAIDTVLAVYTGTSLSSLVQVTATNNVGLSRQAFLNFNAVAATTYHIAVASINSASKGPLRLAVVPGGSVDTNVPTVIVTTPLSGLWVTNRFIAFAGTANDPQPNASSVRQIQLTISSVQGTAPLVWQIIADGTTNWSTPAPLAPGLNRIKVIATDWAGNSSAPVNVQVTLIQEGPSNDLFANAAPLTGTSGSANGSTTNANHELDEPAHAGSPSARSIWYSFTPPSDGILTLDTLGSTFDTVMSLYLGSSVSTLTPIAENDDSGNITSYIAQAVRSNQVYHIAIDGYNGAFGSTFLTYTFTPATVYQLNIAPSTDGSVQVTTTNIRGGVLVMPGLSGDFADNTPLGLTAIPAPFSAFNSWSGGVSSSNNPLSLTIHGNLDIAATFGSFPFTDGFESGDLSQLSWTTGGNAPWFVQSITAAAGQFAARSGVIGDNQSSSLILPANCLAGIGSFDLQVSSETNFDKLSFYVDGVLMSSWSGTVPWANFTFPLTGTNHVLEWRYTKDPSVSAGLDAAFIDDLNLPLVPPSGVPAQAHLQLSQAAGGGFALDIQGQANQQYILQETTDLVHWTSVSTNTAVGGVVHLPVPSGTNQAEFYRAKVIQ